MNEANAGDEYLSLDELRQRIPAHPHRATIWRWTRLGILPAPVRLGLRKLAWRKSEVDRWLKVRHRLELLSGVLSLDDIADGAALDSLNDGDLVALILRVAAVQARVAAYLSRRSAQTEDHLLDADEAALKLGVSKQFLYRRTKRLPFVVPLDGKVRYSARGIERFIAARRG